MKEKKVECSSETGYEVFELRFCGSPRWRNEQKDKFENWVADQGGKAPTYSKDIDLIEYEDEGKILEGYECWCGVFATFIMENYDIKEYSITDTQHHYLV